MAGAGPSVRMGPHPIDDQIAACCLRVLPQPASLCPSRQYQRREARSSQSSNSVAKKWRDGANHSDGYGARATSEEAERWERFAGAAWEELARLLPFRTAISFAVSVLNSSEPQPPTYCFAL